jgi:hypothetical protein
MKIPNHPQEEPMTPILLVLTFLLLLDVLVLVGHGHDSRDGGTGSRAARPGLPGRPLGSADDQAAT